MVCWMGISRASDWCHENISPSIPRGRWLTLKPNAKNLLPLRTSQKQRVEDLEFSPVSPLEPKARWASSWKTDGGTGSDGDASLPPSLQKVHYTVGKQNSPHCNPLHRVFSIRKVFRAFLPRPQFVTDPGSFTLNSFSCADNRRKHICWGGWGAGPSPGPPGLDDAGASQGSSSCDTQKGVGERGARLTTPRGALGKENAVGWLLFPRLLGFEFAMQPEGLVFQVVGERRTPFGFTPTWDSFFPGFVLFAPFSLTVVFFFFLEMQNRRIWLWKGNDLKPFLCNLFSLSFVLFL